MVEILGKIGFDWQVALANLVNFVIIFFVLKKFAFKPIAKIIKERQDKINKGLEDAQKAETELMMAEETRKQKITEAKKEANVIIGEAQKKSDEIVSINKEEGLKIKSSIILEGEKQIQNKKESIKSELETETANLVVDGIEKILKENLTKEQQEKYIKKVLAN
jgi:F-type H+-transporting ATPase subunit b